MTKTMTLISRIITVVICFLIFNVSSYSQTPFLLKKGNKAHYSLEIPENFLPKETIGANIDLKFADKNGASIITNVKKLPPGVADDQITQLSYGTDAQIINQFESNGLENVQIIKRGFQTLNNVKSYFMYYKDTELYYHTINQFVNGYMIILTITCEYSSKASYMPYVYRVVNSLKHF